MISTVSQNIKGNTVCAQYIGKSLIAAKRNICRSETISKIRKKLSKAKFLLQNYSDCKVT